MYIVIEVAGVTACFQADLKNRFNMTIRTLDLGVSSSQDKIGLRIVVEGRIGPV